MKKFALLFAFGMASLAAPSVAQAQALPPAVIAVVDTERVYSECTACVAANQQLATQRQQAQQRAQQLGLSRAQPDQPTSLETELQAIQNAANALAPGQAPDATLQARIDAYQAQLQNAEQEIRNREQQLQRNRIYVLEQIDQRLNPIIVQIMQQRGANLSVPRGSTLAHGPSIEITDAVLATLNQQLPSVNVNAPAPQQPAQPQGR